MRTQFSKLAFAVALMLAITFTFSCSSNDDGGGGGNGSSSSVSSGGKGKSSSSSLKLSSSSEGTSSSSSEDEGSSSSSVSSGYKTVKIGNQIWMAENLNINVSGSKCYDGKSANCNKYGRLYDWETAKSVCPSGWHLPSYEEWETLIETAGTKLKSANGFAALPGGFGYSDGDYSDAEDYGYWWIATEVDEDYAWLWSIDYEYEDVSSDYDYKANLYSVRCVQNTQSGSSSSSGSGSSSPSGGGSSSSVTGVDGSSSSNDGICSGGSGINGGRDKGNDIANYRTTQIGDQVWMAENLNYNVSGSKCGGNDCKLYDENTVNCDKYGRLYNWTAAKSVCPSGWHLPTADDWNVLVKHVCSGISNCADAGTKLKDRDGWISYSGVPSSTDTYGFAALPGGNGDSGGYFNSVGLSGYWWSATEYGAAAAYSRHMGYGFEFVDRYHHDKSDLLSVRCLQD